MSRYFLSIAIIIIAGGFAGCLISQLFHVGEASAFTGYGAGAGAVVAALYYFGTRNNGPTA